MTDFLLGHILKLIIKVAEAVESKNNKYKPIKNLDDNAAHTIQANQFDNNEYEFVENLDKNATCTVTPSAVLFTLGFIALAIAWAQSYDTYQPSNTIFVNKVDNSSSETKMEDLDNIFPSGNCTSSYFQYKRWHRPHTFLLSFNHQELTVTGS